MTDTYYLPADSIDLSYIDRYTKHLDKSPKLWPKTDWNGESKYIQVEIVGRQDCSIVPSDTTPCHICAIDIPLSHIQEHNQSAKHKNFTKILKHALQRSSKQIENAVTANTELKINDSYYCETCCAVINKDGRHEHEQSNQHKKSENIDGIINNFVEIFIQDNNTDNTQNGNSNICVITTDTSVVEEKKINTFDSSFESWDSDRDEIKNETGRNQIIIGHALKQCFREMQSSSNKKIPYIDGDKVEIEYGKVTAVVALDNYNSYVDIEGQTYCQMCKIITSEDLAHTITDNHIKNILKPIGEGFIRMINNIESHCIICNEIIMTCSDHGSLNEEHKKTLRSMIVTNNQTYCKTCNIYIDSHNFKSHEESKKHKMGVDKDKNHTDIIQNQTKTAGTGGASLNVTTNNIDNMKKTKVGLSEKPNSTIDTENSTDKVAINMFVKNNLLTAVNKEKTAYQCNICQETLKSDFVSHVASRRCTDNCFKLINSKKILDFCATCSCKLPSQGTKSHLLGRNHKNNEEILRKMAAKLKLDCTRNHTLAKCDSSIVHKSSFQCKCGVEYFSDELSKHFTSKTHQVYMETLTEFNKITKVGNIYICKLCDEETESSLLDFHVTTQLHIFNLMKTNTIDVAILKKAVYGKIDGSFMNDMLNKIYVNMLAYNLGGFYCKICKVPLPRTCEIEHVLGKPHWSRLNITETGK